MKIKKKKINLFIFMMFVFSFCIGGVEADTNYDLFSNEIKNYVSSLSPTDTILNVKQNFIKKVVELEKKYEDNSRVDYLASKLMAEAINLGEVDTGNYVASIAKKVNYHVEQVGLFDGGSLEASDVWSMKSDTVCKFNSNSKFCVDLKAKVYINDPNSTKWVVLVHGNMMSGEAMANAVGSMYADQGVNILAPDLRGFGDSKGSVAMGYLEALDVHDWLVKLNNTKKVTDVIVHGVSLGGATTLQLWNLKGSTAGVSIDNLKVKGIVDDCGYTSMKGIITGMFSALDLSSGNLDLSGITDVLSDIGLSKEQVSGFSSVFDSYEKYLPQLEGIEEGYNQDINGWMEDVTEYAEQGKNAICSTNPELPFCMSSANSKAKVTLTGLGDSLNLDSILDGLIETALIDLVGVGLTKENFAINQDSFHSSRIAAPINGILIIHGTADTTVPYSNAGVVEQYARSKGVNKIQTYYPSGQPHAFIVIGSNKDEYTKHVQNFAKDILGTKGYSGGSSSSGGGIIGTISNVFSKITSFFKGLFK